MKEDISRIIISNSPVPQMHYISGRTVYCEQFDGTKLIGKYWSANGMIEDGEHITTFHRDTPSQAFSLNLDGQELDWGWTFVSASESEVGGRRQAKVELSHTLRPVKVVVCTEMDGTSFLMRWLEITNTGSAPAALSSLDIFSGVLLSGSALRASTFEETPIQVGRFLGNAWAQEGRFAWEPLRNAVASGLYAAGPYGTGGFQSPYFILASRNTSEHFVFYLGWSGEWKAEITCDTILREMLHVGVGPSSPSPMRMIRSGETIKTPKVHIGYLSGDLDTVVQASHNHIRRSVIPKSPRMPRPLVTQNSYGSCGLDALTEESVLGDVELAHELGCEVYMMDAGWFGKGPGERRSQPLYPRFMGDWVPGSWFPRGLKPIVDSIKKKGMMFGLWIEPEAIGLESEIYKQHPDWIVKREGKPVPHFAERLNIDFSNPEVAVWIESELVRIIRDYGVDVIRFDGAPMSNHIGERTEAGYTENITWRHYELLYGIMERLMVKFPDLLIENCCGGGGRLDLGMLSRSHRTQISDHSGMPRNLQILNGITLMLPPEYCLVFPFYPNVRSNLANLDSVFRSALFADFCNLGITKRIEDQHPSYLAMAKRYISLYKKFVAPLLSDCRIYHHTPVVRMEDPKTPYCVWEYVSADAKSAMIGIFKITDAAESCRFVARGLDVGKKYRVTFDNSGTTAEVDGYSLMQQGITVNLPCALSSELLILELI
jgi:alpha-galactosidase